MGLNFKVIPGVWHTVPTIPIARDLPPPPPPVADRHRHQPPIRHPQPNVETVTTKGTVTTQITDDRLLTGPIVDFVPDDTNLLGTSTKDPDILQINATAPAVLIGGKDSFGPADYPDADIRNGVHGKTIAHYSIGANGRVTECSTNGAPSASLATATCRIIMSRFRFTPAKDAAGNAVTATRTQTVHWVLPAE
jgi:protein TonB